jgi:hypothetical protein
MRRVGDLAVDEVVGVEVPHHPAVTGRDGALGASSEEAALGVGVVLAIAERQRRRRLFEKTSRGSSGM